ncbi:MAG: hypothetical protein QXV17_13800 [Candidatus Micrarchaeaceae archaeon]
MDLDENIGIKILNYDRIEGIYEFHDHNKGNLQLFIISDGRHRRYNIQGDSGIVKFGTSVDKLNEWLSKRGMSLEDFIDTGEDDELDNMVIE